MNQCNISSIKAWERKCSLVASDVLGYAEPSTDYNCHYSRLVSYIMHCHVADAHFVLVCNSTQHKQKLLDPP
jgi:hypothetical protein